MNPTEEKREPKGCKYCSDGVHCDKTFEPAGEYVWVYPCHLLEYPCPDYTPKIDNYADTTRKP